MNVQDLANAVVHWAEYEALCGRAKLLCEASLRSPIGEFLISTEGTALEVEVPYPKGYQAGKGRPRSVDFCVRRAGGEQPWLSILEAKWISKNRDFSQEIFDDLLRLEIVRRTSQNEEFDRLLLLAGRRDDIEKYVFEREANVGGGAGRIDLFRSVLPQGAESVINVRVADADKGIVEYWRESASNCGQTVLPLSLNVKLLASAAASSLRFACWIWRVTSASNRATREVVR